MARTCLEDAITYARGRRTFNKPLIGHQVIRHKIADCARDLEGAWAWLEALAFRYSQDADPRELGKMTALLKVTATRTLEKCAREASQILGGASYLRSGPGERVERIYREVRLLSIGNRSQ
jgi:acyl-CoA dehydrogenase